MNYSQCLNINLDTPSGTPTLLRLISPDNESDGRYVHNLELLPT